MKWKSSKRLKLSRHLQLSSDPKRKHIMIFLYYRKLNAGTVRDSYRIPPMDEGIDSIWDGTIFYTSHASGWKVKIAQRESKNRVGVLSWAEPDHLNSDWIEKCAWYISACIACHWIGNRIPVFFGIPGQYCLVLRGPESTN